MCSPSFSIQKNAERRCTLGFGMHTSQADAAPSVPSKGTASSWPSSKRFPSALITRKTQAVPTPGVLRRTRRQRARSQASRRRLTNTTQKAVRTAR